MGTCEICGRRWGTLSHECGRHEASRTHGATACYRIGYERERKRADAADAQVAAMAAEIETWVAAGAVVLFRDYRLDEYCKPRPEAPDPVRTAVRILVAEWVASKRTEKLRRESAGEVERGRSL